MNEIEQHIATQYERDYQPIYPDQSQLDAAVDMVSKTTPPTSTRNIERFLASLKEVQSGNKALSILGPCAEEIKIEESLDAVEQGIAGIGNGYIALDALSRAVLGKSNAVSVVRGLGQSTKPRSNAFERINGNLIPSYMGDAVNNSDRSARTPDPSRMVAMVDQARDVRDYMNHVAGRHIPAAHELLLLPYESALLQETDDGTYSLSADMLWIGDRTKRNTRFLEFLGSIENARGVKIGPGTTTDDIAQIAKHLHRPDRPGGLSFMLRLGLKHIEQADPLIDAIEEHAPNSLVLYDPHGLTYSVDGQKTRAVSDAQAEISELNTIANRCGRLLNGVILESIASYTVQQCVDERSQKPKDQSLVDPQFNLDQTEDILRVFKSLAVG